MTRSRRAVLSACGAGLVALAGCSTLDSGDDAPAYDRDRLAALRDRETPRPPAAFPVSVPDAMLDRHRQRARTLVERVPADPDVPNGVVVERLRAERDEVLEDLDGDGAHRDDPVDEPLDRLDHVRGVRRRAANVDAAYRAATDDITAGAVAERRERLRSDRLGFETDWTYRGDDPFAAVVVHRTLEDLRRDVRRIITPERAFPADSTTAVFRVGEIVARLESGRATLTDAERLRARYRDGMSDPRSFHDAFSVASTRLRRTAMFRWRRLHEYDDPDREELPFERSIEGTPVERLYRDVARSVRRRREEANRAHRRGDPATALVEAGLGLAAWRTLDAVVTDVDDGELEPPASADAVAAARRNAVDALRTAWNATPTIIAATLARPATYRFAQGMHDLGDGLDGGPPDAYDAERAFVNFAYAARFAAAAPPTVSAVEATLTDLVR